MHPSQSSTGYFKGGMPYNRIGSGPQPLVVFQGLFFENKPVSPMMVEGYKFLGRRYTVYDVLRKLGLAQGASLADMANDYAAMIRAEFGGPLDIIGISTGGSIVQHFAADHPELVRRLVIHSSAYVLSEPARALQLRLAELGAQRRWADAYREMAGFILAKRWKTGRLSRPLAWLMGTLMAWLDSPKDPSDLVITVAAEDRHNFKERLGEIKAPTLVAAGELDPFYTPELFRETAAGIPNARLALYPNVGHPAAGKQFESDVLAFLEEGQP